MHSFNTEQAANHYFRLYIDILCWCDSADPDMLCSYDTKLKPRLKNVPEI